METIGKIRRLYYVEGKGYKTIARELRLSKNTVKKALQQGVTKTQYQCTHKKYRVLGSYVDRLRGCNQEPSKVCSRPCNTLYIKPLNGIKFSNTKFVELNTMMQQS